ncbi:MAG: hypothetical protein ACTHJN_09475 [Ginsengibacter sp.]
MQRRKPWFNVARMFNSVNTLNLRNCLILCLIYVCVNTSCKKQSDGVSPDHIIFSLNDSLPATCSIKVRDPDNEYVGNPNCELEIDRQGRFKTGEAADIGIFEENNCDLATGPLPYQTHFFRCAIIVYQHPWEAVTYVYDRGTYWPDSTATTPGDLVLTITKRDNNRVKGTVTGTIYKSNVGLNLVPAKLSCTFDLLIPVTK